MSSNVYFSRIPYRNAFLQLNNCISSGNIHTELLERYGINLVLDVGANRGQYARGLKRHGYRGRIVSFEPQPEAFRGLNESRWGFSSWQTENFALGADNCTATLNVAGNSQSSSLQSMHANHEMAAPDSAYVGRIDVQVRRLDSILDRYYRDGDRCFVKMDVQGHEHSVLQGASGCLDKIIGFEAELSLIPLYEGQLLWQESIAHMNDLGFEMAMLEPGFQDARTGVMLQADGIFIRKSAVDQLRMVTQSA